jgi:hypothetical protein
MGGKRTFEAVAFRVDFSAILILPFSALVAFATLILAAIAKHPPPRLIWPCAFSTLAAGIMLLRLPELSALGLWVFTLFWMAFFAAIGTVIGAAGARLGIAAICSLRRS